MLGVQFEVPRHQERARFVSVFVFLLMPLRGLETGPCVRFRFACEKLSTVHILYTHGAYRITGAEARQRIGDLFGLENCYLHMSHSWDMSGGAIHDNDTIVAYTTIVLKRRPSRWDKLQPLLVLRGATPPGRHS